MPSCLVKDWFGDEFNSLHPLLRDMHTQGAVLKGKVHISVGGGLGKYIGKAIAKKLGIPLAPSEQDFEVTVSHTNTMLNWTRRFGKSAVALSKFEPIGNKTTGYWLENTGVLTLALTVDIIEGGWYWRCLKAWVKDIRVPLFLFPKTTAFKRIENGKYRFYVELSLPLLGKVLAYQGDLEAAISSRS